MNDQPVQSRPLPHHERHRRTLLAAIAAERAHEQAAGRRTRPDDEPSHRRGLVASAMAAAAVLIVAAAGIGAHAWLRPDSQAGRPGARSTTAATRPTASPGPSAVGGGQRSLTQKFSITAPVSSLIVNDAVGSVSVASGSGSQVSVTAVIYYRSSRPTISHPISGRTLTLGYSACVDCGVAFTVTVPRTASVTINEHTGNVTVTGLAGDVSVQNGTGLITGTGLSATRASFRDRNGSINVAFAAPPRQLSAVSDVGLVSVRVPSGTTYNVSASSQLGPVDVSVPRSPAATHMITVATITGMVSVSVG